MNFTPLNSKEKKKLLEELERIYGIAELNYYLVEAGKRRVRAFSGNLDKNQIADIYNSVGIELIGMYFISQKDEEPRLNYDAVSLLREQITKEFVEISEEQFQKWIRGHDLDIKTQRGTLVIKFKDDLIGIGKSNGEKIFNYIPKERKLKTPLKI